jgi:hypothetical protein
MCDRNQVSQLIAYVGSSCKPQYAGQTWPLPHYSPQPAPSHSMSTGQWKTWLLSRHTEQATESLGIVWQRGQYELKDSILGGGTE